MMERGASGRSKSTTCVVNHALNRSNVAVCIINANTSVFHGHRGAMRRHDSIAHREAAAKCERRIDFVRSPPSVSGMNEVEKHQALIAEIPVGIITGDVSGFCAQKFHGPPGIRPASIYEPAQIDDQPMQHPSGIHGFEELGDGSVA